MLKVILLCLSVNVFSSNAWQCGFNSEVMPQLQRLQSRGRALAEIPNPVRLNGQKQNLRIHFDYSFLDQATSLQKSYIQQRLIPASESWLRETLKVVPISGNLKLSEHKNLFYMIDPDAYNENWCSDKFLIPTSEWTDGASNSDLIIYVLDDNESSKKKNYVAYAKSCIYHTSDYRPVAGLINYNLAYLQTDDAHWDANVATTVHEITHVLAFDPLLYYFFTDSNGQLYQDVNKEYTETNDEGETRKTQWIVTPKVKQTAVNHFDCRSIKGVGLEDFGGNGSAGAHWEMRHLFNDFMVYSDMRDIVYSSFSLALFEDTGWYAVEWDQAENLPWGYKKGCDFVNKKCITYSANTQTYSTPWPDHFCTESGKTGCTHDKYYTGECLLYDHQARAVDFWEYFGDESTGGHYAGADYCPTYISINQGLQRDEKGSDCRLQQFYNDPNYQTLGETLGSDSRCHAFDFDSQTTSRNVGCFRTSCIGVGGSGSGSGTIEITFSDSTKATCTSSQRGTSIDTSFGQWTCPDDYSLYCSAESASCPNQCSGHGSCVSGSCRCEPGHSGNDCSTSDNNNNGDQPNPSPSPDDTNDDRKDNGHILWICLISVLVFL